jgi:cytochrome c oxidase subunit II
LNELMRTLWFLPEQASSIARELDALHYFVITVTMIGAAAVTVIGGYYLLRYRAGAQPVDDQGAQPELPQEGLHGVPIWAELAAIAGLLGMFVLWWFIGFNQFVRIRVPPEKTIDVYVTGKQWMWSFAYTDGQGSSGTLFVPERTPIKLIMTSRDVIHSFWVPEFRVKQDVLPGRFTTLWFEAERAGTFPIMCAEYCGLSHSGMRGQVVVVEQSRWPVREEGRDRLPLVSQLAGPDAQAEQGPPLAQRGELAAVDYGCTRCHTSDGTPHIGPTWAGLYRSRVPLERGEDVLADEEYLTEAMMDPTAQVHRGFAPVMPSYFGALPAAETAAIVEYIKSLRDVRREPAVQVFVQGQAQIPAPEVPGGEGQPLPPQLPGSPRSARAPSEGQP